MSVSIPTLKKELLRAVDRAYLQNAQGEPSLHDLTQAHYIFGVMAGRGFDIHSGEGADIQRELQSVREFFEDPRR